MVMKNIHILPTPNSSRLYLTTKEYVFEEVNSVSTDECENKHIYITNDEEIKEGDWFITTDNNEIHKSDWIKFHFDNGKKIILTTDQDLIKDGVQSIPDEFLEWFVKNPSCDEVEVKPLLSNNGRALFGYKIIIPKEEPKQETLEEDLKFPIIIENGMDYLNLTTKIFNNGTKWQKERSYSEEEVKNIVDKTIEKFYKRFYTLTKAEMKEEWFEQFKKK